MLVGEESLGAVLGNEKAKRKIWFDPAACVELPSAEYVSEHLFSPCEVVEDAAGEGGGEGGDSKAGESEHVVVKTGDGQSHTLRRADVDYVQDDSDIGSDDILSMNDFSRASLLHSLRVRFEKDQVYTFVGGILISLNPFKWIEDAETGESIYSNNTMASYKGALVGQKVPHLFVVADQAYTELVLKGEDRSNAAIVVSGESGASSLVCVVCFGLVEGWQIAFVLKRRAE
jgi:hypothetical protein